MVCWRQTKRTSSLVPWEKKAKRRHEEQYLLSYRCWKGLRRLLEVKTRMTLKPGMCPLYGSPVTCDALTTVLVTRRLPVSPSAHRRRRHVRHLCYVETGNPCDPSFRSGQRKGGALPEELSPPFLKASPQNGRFFPTTKHWNVSKDRNLKNPRLFSLSFPPAVTFWFCGSSLSLCSSSRCILSLSVRSIITQPPVCVKKGLILPAVLITALLNCRLD